MLLRHHGRPGETTVPGFGQEEAGRSRSAFDSSWSRAGVRKTGKHRREDGGEGIDRGCSHCFVGCAEREQK